MARDKNDSRSPAEWLSGIAEPTRLTILKVLAAGARTVTELAKACETEMVNISHHVNLMKNLGLLSDPSVGAENNRRKGNSSSRQNGDSTPESPKKSCSCPGKIAETSGP
jgi:DNA-binding transcriptional ArsR family regulator